jgi:hypothetical protein
MGRRVNGQLGYNVSASVSSTTSMKIKNFTDLTFSIAVTGEILEKTLFTESVNKPSSGNNGGGGTGEVQNQFTFASASAEWSVPHSFGYKPAVEVLDSTGTSIEGCVQHISDNLLRVSFLVPMTGTVAVT